MDRLTKMASLTEDWYGEGSIPPSTAVLDRARRVVDAVVDLPADFTPAPLPDGGVRFEWRRGQADHVLEIGPGGGMYVCLLQDDGRDADREYAAFDAEAAKAFLLTSQRGCHLSPEPDAQRPAPITP